VLRAPLEDRRNPYPLHLAPDVKVHPTLGLVPRRAALGRCTVTVQWRDQSVVRTVQIDQLPAACQCHPSGQWIIHPVHSVELNGEPSEGAVPSQVPNRNVEYFG